MILLVIRPLVTRAFEAIPVAVGESAEAKLLAEQAAAAAPALLGPGGEPISTGMEDEEEKYDELIDIDRVEGRVKASSVKRSERSSTSTRKKPCRLFADVSRTKSHSN